MKAVFLTVPEELLEHATNALLYFSQHEYRVKPELSSLEYPNTPTMVATRGRTTIVCEVWKLVDIGNVRNWVGYAKSCERDTRIVVVVPDKARIKAADERVLVELGVGMLVSGEGGIYEKLAARDQAISLGLPELTTLPPKLRRMVAPIYEKFDRDWQDAFKDACTLVEVEARRHLAKGMSTGRVQLVTSGGVPSKLTAAKINKLPAGPLADAYAMIVSPNQTDVVAEQALRLLNDDRVAAVHRKPRSEARLRKSVGRHMFVVINALRQLVRG
jgi:hypothetical protein